MAQPTDRQLRSQVRESAVGAFLYGWCAVLMIIVTAALVFHPLYVWLQTGSGYSLSTMRLLVAITDAPQDSWLREPTEWIGVWKILDTVPACISTALLAWAGLTSHESCSQSKLKARHQLKERAAKSTAKV
jgi:hypothetical protein